MALLLGQRGRGDCTQPALSSHLPRGVARARRGWLKNAPDRCSRVSPFIISLLLRPSVLGGVQVPKTQEPMGWSRVGFRWELHGGTAVWVQEPLVRASAPTPQAEAALLHPSRASL